MTTRHTLTYYLYRAVTLSLSLTHDLKSYDCIFPLLWTVCPCSDLVLACDYKTPSNLFSISLSLCLCLYLMIWKLMIMIMIIVMNYAFNVNFLVWENGSAAPRSWSQGIFLKFKYCSWIWRCCMSKKSWPFHRVSCCIKWTSLLEYENNKNM